MEFWGVELKGDKPVKVEPGMDEVVHLSQATLAELEGVETVMLYAKVGKQKLVIGVLNAENAPQLSFDLVFEKEFELSHNWKNGSIHLTGYRSVIPDDVEKDIPDYSDEDEVFLEERLNHAKAKRSAPVAKAADDEPTEESDEDDETDEDDDDDEDESGEEGEADEEMADGDDSDSEEDESDEEEEETPAKSAANKKRPAPASKTPEAKKVNVITPLKTDGKKGSGGHIDTPYPAKNAKTPKSGGTGKKNFNSPVGLGSQKKGKHSGKK